jgi:hypothetical protein
MCDCRPGTSAIAKPAVDHKQISPYRSVLVADEGASIILRAPRRIEACSHRSCKRPGVGADHDEWISRADRHVTRPLQDIKRAAASADRILDLSMRPFEWVHSTIKSTLGEQWLPIGVNMLLSIN